MNLHPVAQRILDGERVCWCEIYASAADRAQELGIPSYDAHALVVRHEGAARCWCVPLRAKLMSGEVDDPVAIVDVDGTLCDVSSVRYHVDPTDPRSGGRKDFSAFHGASIDCPPHAWVVELVRLLSREGIRIVVVTARMAMWRYHTILWLTENEVPYDELLMREDGDSRRDIEVKAELLAQIVRQGTPVLAIDDNPNVLGLWSDAGIPTMRVPGWSS